MTEIEKKAEEMRKASETAAAEAKAAKEKAEAAEKKAADTEQKLDDASKTIEEQKKAIDNLDKSIKSQQEIIETLRKSIQEQPKSFRKAMREALDAKKDYITEQFKTSDKFTIELKLATSDITAQSGAQALGTVMDPNVHAVPLLSNAFILAFGTRELTGPRLGWVEASTSKNVGYVKELTANSNKTTTTFSEKFRKPAKIATYMEVSSEFETWFESLYNFCVDEGQRLILKDADEKIWSGQGNDSSKQDEIYGLKSNNTAFAALGKYQNATIADVILDAVAQIRKAGYSANVAIVSYATEAKLKGLKDANNNYIYDRVSQKLGQVTIIPAEQLSDTEIFVADNSCAEIYFGSIYEMEFTRQASTDSWRVDLRKHVQVKVTTPKKKGLVYVSDIDTAKTSINEAAAAAKA